MSAGRLDFEATWHLLAAAARDAGLDEREVHATLKSGLPSGIAANPPTDLAELLDSVERLYRRFLVFGNDHAPVALALWASHTYAFDAARYTPYQKVWSPEPQSGKTP